MHVGWVGFSSGRTSAQNLASEPIGEAPEMEHLLRLCESLLVGLEPPN